MAAWRGQLLSTRGVLDRERGASRGIVVQPLKQQARARTTGWLGRPLRCPLRCQLGFPWGVAYYQRDDRHIFKVTRQDCTGRWSSRWLCALRGASARALIAYAALLRSNPARSCSAASRHYCLIKAATRILKIRECDCTGGNRPHSLPATEKHFPELGRIGTLRDPSPEQYRSRPSASPSACRSHHPYTLLS